jgi:hypothetical protein
MTTEKYNFPVFATQGGGLAQKLGKSFVFVEAPDCPGLSVGDLVPEEWEIAATDDQSRDALVEGDSFDEPFSDEERFWIQEKGLNKF